MTHLTAAERGKIEILLQDQYTNKSIALKLGRSPSGIGRETVAVPALRQTEAHQTHRPVDAPTRDTQPGVDSRPTSSGC